jgi:hypothetical protein
VSRRERCAYAPTSQPSRASSDCFTPWPLRVDHTEVDAVADDRRIGGIRSAGDDPTVPQHALLHRAKLGDRPLAVQVATAGDELHPDGARIEPLERMTQHEVLRLRVHLRAVMGPTDPRPADLDSTARSADVHEGGPPDRPTGALQDDREGDRRVQRRDPLELPLEAPDAPLQRGLWRVAEELTVRGGEEIRGVPWRERLERDAPTLQHQWGNPHGRRSSYFVLDSAGVAAVAGLVSHRAGVGPSGAVIAMIAHAVP